MNIYLAGIFVAMFAVGYFAGAYIRYLGFKNKIKKVRDFQYASLKRIFDLTNARAKVTTGELSQFADFVNEQLPKDITNICISEPKLIILKEKAGVSDKVYLEAIESIIVNIQNTVSSRLMRAVEKITAETVKEIKGLMDESN